MTIANKGILIDLTQRVWRAVSSDRGLASRVEKDNSAEYKTMRVVKQLVPREKLLPINRLVAYGREHHDKLTLPGLMKGQQLTAPKRLGSAFRASDFPRVDNIISFFSYEHRFSPVPDGQNDYVDLYLDLKGWALTKVLPENLYYTPPRMTWVPARDETWLNEPRWVEPKRKWWGTW